MSYATINAILGLHHDGQDWGIVNSDGRRLQEFIDYWIAHRSELAGAEWDFLELCLASADDAVDGGQPVEQVTIMLSQIPAELCDGPQLMEIEYWISFLAKQHETPRRELGQWLERHLEVLKAQVKSSECGA